MKNVILIFAVFSQHEYDKWTSYQKNKREIEKRRMAEAQERSKQEMLKTLEGEDISHIDINSDQGNSHFLKLETLRKRKKYRISL